MPDALDGDFSKSRAVLIGTWSYQNLPPVPAAENSLHRMRDLLTSGPCGPWPAESVREVPDPRTLGTLPRELVTWFGEATDVALFYYVGHGQYDMDDQLCLAMQDTSSEAPLRTTTSLAYETVRQAFKHSRASTKIAILDCCFAGLASGQHGRLGGTHDPPRSPGFYLMMASGEFSTAWFQTSAESETPQTYFTKYLIDVIERGIPGQPQGLALGPIFHAAADALVLAGKPEPDYRAGGHGAEFVLARNAAHGTVVPDETPSALQASPKGPVRPNRVRKRAGGAIAAVMVLMVLIGFYAYPDRHNPKQPAVTQHSSAPPALPALTPIGKLTTPSAVGRFTFAPDGRTLATVMGGTTVQLWDMSTHEPVGNTFTTPNSTAGKGFFNDVEDIAFGPTGPLAEVQIVTRTPSNDLQYQAQLWDVQGRELGTLPDSNDESALFSSDGRYIATFNNAPDTNLTSVQVWDTASRQQVGKTIHINDAIYLRGGVALSPDDHTLAIDTSIGMQNEVNTPGGETAIWSIASGTPIGAPLRLPYDDPGYSLAFSPDGKTLAIARMGSVQLWSTESHLQIGAPFGPGHTPIPDEVAISPDGRTLVLLESSPCITSDRSTLWIWDIASHRQIRQTVTGCTGGFEISPDGKVLATTERFGVQLWQMPSHS